MAENRPLRPSKLLCGQIYVAHPYCQLEAVCGCFIAVNEPCKCLYGDIVLSVMVVVGIFLKEVNKFFRYGENGYIPIGRKSQKNPPPSKSGGFLSINRVAA